MTPHDTYPDLKKTIPMYFYFELFKLFFFFNSKFVTAINPGSKLRAFVSKNLKIGETALVFGI